MFRFATIIIGGFLTMNVAFAASEQPSPPFPKGENFIISRAYNTPATHVRLDAYALDFTQNGCEAFRKDALATLGGEVKRINDSDPLNGYGFFVLLSHGDGTQSRYAHLAEVSVERGFVVRGTVVGLIGNTGNVSGTSCKEHQGTHLHFAMYKDGIAHKPEPMEECTVVASGV